MWHTDTNRESARRPNNNPGISSSSIMIRQACEFDLLMFDFGGVLTDWNGIEGVLEVSGRSPSREDARRFWLESPWVRKFERGQCTPEAFAEGVVQELDCRLDAGAFLQTFISWDRGPFPGSRELLAKLGESHELACLTNNNEIHWRRLLDIYGFGRYFQHCFASHEIGFVKPDPEIYEFILSRLPYPASGIVYFDDNHECVTAAARFGIRAYQVRGVHETRQVLANLGCRA